MKGFLVNLAAAVAIIMAFGKKGHASPKPGFGEPGFDSTDIVNGLRVRVTGASFVKVGTRYYDANTGQPISPEEAARRAASEGQALP